MKPIPQRHEIIAVGNQWGLGFTSDGVTRILAVNPCSGNLTYYGLNEHPDLCILFDTREEVEFVLTQLRLEGGDEILRY